MSRSFRPAVLASLACALALGGCGFSLLPSTPPAQLYRFGANGAAPPQPGAPVQAAVEQKATVLLDGVVMSRAALGDQILTVAGDQAAYLDGARWAAPATVLFGEAVERAFDEHARRTRLTPRGGLGHTDASLRLVVRDFQADYGAARFPPPPEKGKRPPPPPNLPPPTAVVALRARLTALDGRLIAERDFSVRRPAAENRVGAIVPALDAATAEVLGQVVAWTDANAPPPTASSAAASDPPPPSRPARVVRR